MPSNEGIVTERHSTGTSENYRVVRNADWVVINSTATAVTTSTYRTVADNNSTYVSSGIWRSSYTAISNTDDDIHRHYVNECHEMARAEGFRDADDMMQQGNEIPIDVPPFPVVRGEGGDLWRTMIHDADIGLRTEAAKRAMSFLCSTLTSEQLHMMDEHGYFEIVVPSGNRYRILVNRGISGNVEQIDEEGTMNRLCAHPIGVPAGDVFLTQKLALETDEPGFLRKANCHYVRAA